MKEEFNPDLFVAKWYCSQAWSEDMPAFAADALEAGYDGEALRRLAGLVKPTSSDVGELFQQSVAEIGTVRVHNSEEAALLLAQTTARDIVNGQMDPIAGCNFLAWLAHGLNYPPHLTRFYGLADLPRWGEWAPPRAKLIKDIIEEARLLLASIPE